MSSRGVTRLFAGAARPTAGAVVLLAAISACGDAERAAPLREPSMDAAATGGRPASSDAGALPADGSGAGANLDAESAETGSPRDVHVDGGSLDAPFIPIPYDGDIGPMDGREPVAGCSFVPPGCRSLCSRIAVADSCSALYDSVETCECSCAAEMTQDCSGELDDLLACAPPDSAFHCAQGYPTAAGCGQEARALDDCAYPETPVCEDVPSCNAFCDLIAPLGCGGANTDRASCVCRCENELSVFRPCVAELDAFIACHSSERVTAVCDDGRPAIEPSACDGEWSALQACARIDGGIGSEL